MDNKEIENLMRLAIEYPRPEAIKPYCSDVWNQPFFFKIDKAKVLTISYNPSDKGTKANYNGYIEQYKKEGNLDTNTILNILYNYSTKDNKWRDMHNILFAHLGFDDDVIAHMDVSSFPYKESKYYQENRIIDNSDKFLLQTIELLKDQLKIIFVDGKNNKSFIYKIMQNDDWICVDKTAMAINSGNKKYDLLIFKHNSTYLIYYGCLLYGRNPPSKDQMGIIANHIKTIIQQQQL